MFKELLNKCITGGVLSEQEACSMMDTIMQGQATPSQIASLLSILRFRGETIDEMTGFTKSMRSHMTTLSYDHEVIDTCGTGGDGASTFNISTASAIVASALGVKVAKHGNRAVSSKSGSADVLEELGIDIQETQEDAAKALNDHGMSFLFAPLYHRAMKHAVAPRKEIGFRTVFNLLGPLSNPARSKRQVIGVFSTDYAEKMAHTLRNLGSEHVLFVTGRDGLDECSITAATDVVELKSGVISRYVLEPEDVGLSKGKSEDIRVSTVTESASLIKSIFLNNANQSATDIVLFNSGVALYVGGKVDTISEGVKLAKSAIEDGIVSNHFDNLRTRKVKDYVK